MLTLPGLDLFQAEREKLFTDNVCVLCQILHQQKQQSQKLLINDLTGLLQMQSQLLNQQLQKESIPKGNSNFKWQQQQQQQQQQQSAVKSETDCNIALKQHLKHQRVVKDEAHVCHPDQSYDYDIILKVLTGSLTLVVICTDSGQEKVVSLTAGQSYAIPADCPYAMSIGANGATYCESFHSSPQ
ncbi:hypothetical protein MIR68_000166 [Amoeboaphelidium protococcarum]|nr:hypothetical protein MIR68_000166 [Amoeboaphelidium protococcarum]KAI3648930.1 hypothetical protein MP228_006784 [Amoeboaphelidium protococcarum]